MSKPIASLSLDLDNKWSYLKTRGEPGWQSFPSYLDVVVPRVLAFLKAKNMSITVFVVGQDAALERNHEVLKSIAAAGHEVGNHSFRHEPWMRLYSRQEIEAEIASAEEHIERATGQTPAGFRAPGHSLSREALQVLMRHGYQYDASTLPTFVTPLVNAFYFRNHDKEQRRFARSLGGPFREGLRSLRPYRWRLDGGTLMELPVTTMPMFRVPIHFTILMALHAVSPVLARQYFCFALGLCRLNGIQPSLHLHPTDFIDRDDAPDLSFFPTINIPQEEKLQLISDTLDLLSSQYRVLTLQQHVSEVGRVGDVPVVEPRFSRHAGNGCGAPRKQE